MDGTYPRHGRVLDADMSWTRTCPRRDGSWTWTGPGRGRVLDRFFLGWPLQWGGLGLHGGGRALRLERAGGPSAAARAG